VAASNGFLACGSKEEHFYIVAKFRHDIEKINYRSAEGYTAFGHAIA